MKPSDPTLGRAYTLQHFLIAWFRERVLDLVQDGGVEVNELRRVVMASQARLPVDVVAKLFDRWITDGDDGPALLERTGRNRYALADNEAHRKAREFLLKAGQETAKGWKGKKRGRKRG